MLSQDLIALFFLFCYLKNNSYMLPTTAPLGLEALESKIWNFTVFKADHLSFSDMAYQDNEARTY